MNITRKPSRATATQIWMGSGGFKKEERVPNPRPWARGRISMCRWDGYWCSSSGKWSMGWNVWNSLASFPSGERFANSPSGFWVVHKHHLCLEEVETLHNRDKISHDAHSTIICPSFPKILPECVHKRTECMFSSYPHKMNLYSEPQECTWNL